MGQSVAIAPFNGKIHPKDEDRMYIFNYTWKRKELPFGDYNEYTTKYDTYFDESKENKQNLENNIISKGGQGLICRVKNNPNLIAKIVNSIPNRFLASFQQFSLMKSTNILYYENVFTPNQDDSLCIIYIIEKLKYSLHEYITSKSKNINCNEEDAKLIIFDILNCLNTIHLSHFIHYDLNPFNIMYRNNDFIGPNDNILYKKGWVIIDYNTMRQCYRQGTYFKNYAYESDAEGNPGWNAPEIAKMVYKPYPTKIIYSTDLWSIGLLILFILFKKQPFQIDKKNQNQNIKNNPFELILSEWELIKYLKQLRDTSKISAQLYKLLKNGLLVYNKKKRMQTVEEVYKSAWFDSIRNTNTAGENAIINDIS